MKKQEKLVGWLVGLCFIAYQLLWVIQSQILLFFNLWFVSLYVTLFSNELLGLICLNTFKWFQVFLYNISNSIYPGFLCNMNNSHVAVEFQINNNNPS